jgi:DNA repair protein RadC
MDPSTVKAALALVGVTLLDHLIVGGRDVMSLAEAGCL